MKEHQPIPSDLQSTPRTDAEIMRIRYEIQPMLEVKQFQDVADYSTECLASFARTLERALNVAKAQPAENEDTERLDWLENNKADVDFPGEDDGPNIIIYTPQKPLGGGTASGRTLREAIDKARRGGKE